MIDLAEAIEGLASVIEAQPINALADLIEKRKGAVGSYYYEDVTVKRWILGPGGVSGNCEQCVENSEAGEIEESEPFPAYSQYGPVTEPPLHTNCSCLVEYRDTRRRVYV